MMRSNIYITFVTFIITLLININVYLIYHHDTDWDEIDISR